MIWKLAAVDSDEYMSLECRLPHAGFVQPLDLQRPQIQMGCVGIVQL